MTETLKCTVCGTEYEKGKGWCCAYGHDGFCSAECATECYNEDNAMNADYEPPAYREG